MIVNSSIKSGFLKAKIKGKYFGLVSCSGIVRVILWRNGSPVLDSKMWVGMNLPEALPFDEVQFESEVDQPVEFWAGDVSMQSGGLATLRGASALRTNTVLVNGKAAIVESDLTRQSVRVRTDTDITIGGASISGMGWRQYANTTQEYPVAGTLYAYKAPPVIDVNDAEFVESTANKYLAGGYPDRLIVSADGQKMLSWLENELPKKWSQSTGVWEDITGISSTALYSTYAHFVDSLNAVILVCCHATAGNHALNNKMKIRLYITYDFGDTWSNFKTILPADYIATSKVNNGLINTRSNIKGSLLTHSTGGLAFAINLASDNVKMWAAGDLSVGVANDGGILHFEALNDDFSHVLYLNYIDYKLRKSTDGGVTWQVLDDVYSVGDFIVGDSQNFLIYYSSGKSIYLTNDGGQTFIDTTRDMSNGIEDSAEYFGEGQWLRFNSDTLESFKIVNGLMEVQTSIAYQALADSHERPYLCNDGKVLRMSGGVTGEFAHVDVWSVNFGGTLKPAVVEVMELLA